MRNKYVDYHHQVTKYLTELKQSGSIIEEFVTSASDISLSAGAFKA